MAGEATIDSILIEVSSNAERAESGIRAAADALGALKSSIPSGSAVTRLNGIADSLGRISSKVSGLHGLGSAGGALSQLATGVDRLGNSKTPSKALGANLDNIISAAKKIDGGSAARLQALGSAMKGVGEAKAVGKNAGANLESVVSALGKFKAMDFGSFQGEVDKLSASLDKLGKSMQSVGAGYKSMPRSMKGAATAARSATSANTWTSNLAGMRKDGTTSFASGGTGAANSTRTGGIYGGLGGSRSSMFAGFAGGAAGFAASVSPMTAGLAGVTAAAGQAISKFSDYTEDVNLFTVAMGQYASQSYDYAQSMQATMGIDAGQWMRNQGVFMTLANGMGVATDSAATMSKQLTQLGYDLSSFYNISQDDAMLKLQSGLSGELEPLRRLGYDLSVAKMQQTAYNLGIKESVQNMTQATKVQLRYYMIMKQVSQAHGDMARTINQPANAMRVFWAQVEVLARNVGQLLIPALNAVLPVLTAIVMLANDAAQAIANFFGYKMELPDTTSVDYSGMGDDAQDGLGKVADAADGAKKATEGAGKAAKEAKKQLLGFDKINNLTKDSDSGGSGGGGGNGGNGGNGGGNAKVDVPIPTYTPTGVDPNKLKDALKEILKHLRLIQGIIRSIAKLLKTLKMPKVEVPKELKDVKGFLEEPHQLKIEGPKNLAELNGALKELNGLKTLKAPEIRLALPKGFEEIKGFLEEPHTIKLADIGELPKLTSVRDFLGEVHEVKMKPLALPKGIDEIKGFFEEPHEVKAKPFSAPKGVDDMRTFFSEPHEVKLTARIEEFAKTLRAGIVSKLADIRIGLKLPDVGKMISDLKTRFVTAASEIGGQFAKGISSAIAAIEVKLPNIPSLKSLPFFSEIPEIGAALDKLGFGKLIDSALKFAKVLLRVAGPIGDIINLIEIIRGIHDMFTANGNVDQFRDALGRVLESFALIVAFIAPPAGLIVAAVTGGIGLILRNWNTVVSVIDNAKQTIANLGDTIKQSFDSLMSGNGFGGPVWDGFVQGATTAFETVSTAASQLPGTIAGFFGGIGEKIGGFFAPLLTMVQGTFSSAVTFVSGVPGSIAGFFTNIVADIAVFFANLPTTLINVFNAAVTLVKSIPGAIVGLFTNIVSNIKQKFTGTSTAVSSGFESGKQMVSSIPGAIVEFFKSIVNDVKEKFVGMKEAVSEKFEAAKEFISEIPGKIVDFFTNTASDVTEKFAKLKELVGKKFTDMVDGLKNIPKNITDKFNDTASGVQSKFNDLKTKVKGKFDDMVEGLKDIPKNIVDKFRGLGKSITDAIGSIHFPTPHIDWEEIKIGDTGISLPKVNWYRTGGYFPDEALIGVGDAPGGEWVMQRRNLQDVADILASRISSTGAMETGIERARAKVESAGAASSARAQADTSALVHAVANGVASASAEQNRLLVEQNRLLRQILAKDGGGQAQITGADIAHALNRSARKAGRAVYSA